MALCGCGEVVKDLRVHVRNCTWFVSARKQMKGLPEAKRLEVSALLERLLRLKDVVSQNYRRN